MAVRMMPNMTIEQQIAGARRAIESLSSRRGGPVWLLPSLRKRLKALREEKRRRAQRR